MTERIKAPGTFFGSLEGDKSKEISTHDPMHRHRKSDGNREHGDYIRQSEVPESRP